MSSDIRYTYTVYTLQASRQRNVSMERLAVYVYLSRDVWLILEFKNGGMLSINIVKARATFSGFDKTRYI